MCDQCSAIAMMVAWRGGFVCKVKSIPCSVSEPLSSDFSSSYYTVSKHSHTGWKYDGLFMYTHHEINNEVEWHVCERVYLNLRQRFMHTFLLKDNQACILIDRNTGSLRSAQTLVSDPGALSQGGFSVERPGSRCFTSLRLPLSVQSLKTIVCNLSLR